MELNFWKYEGAGNDFVMIDGRVDNTDLPGDIIRLLCNRHLGVGADGLLIMCNESGYDFRMKYFNSDGGEANMCGNGGRCIALFADHLGIGIDEKHFIGRDGEHWARIVTHEQDGSQVELGMIDVESYEYSDRAFYLNTGVPHMVEFVEDLDLVDVMAHGREVRNSERFKASGGTNVDFVQIEGFGQIKVRTYERGVENETLSCGTGAVAAAIATHLYAQNDCNDFTVETPGGQLDVRFTVNERRFESIRLSGPARRVFKGSIKLNF